MKKVSTAATMQSRNISRQKLTLGLDLGDRNCWSAPPPHQRPAQPNSIPVPPPRASHICLLVDRAL